MHPTKGTRLTKAYWMSLSVGTRIRALLTVFGNEAVAQIYALDEPLDDDIWWRHTLEVITVPDARSGYKLCVGGTSYCN